MTPPTISIVIAQCVQRSFISPLAGPDPRLKPCHLHCGYANAVRLLGGGPQRMPNVLEDFLWQAHGGEDGTLPGSQHVHIVYVDDEHHDDGSELTREHFAQFGRHCVPGEVDERGIEGYLGTGRTAEWRSLHNGRTHVVRTPGLNDNMFGTGFIPVLTSICQESEEVYGVRPEDIQILNRFLAAAQAAAVARPAALHPRVSGTLPPRDRGCRPSGSPGRARTAPRSAARRPDRRAPH